jgi:hypothetical protein
MSEVGIDALTIKTRAVVRELNGLLAKLHAAQVNVKIASWENTRDATNNKPTRMTLTMTFPIETDE